MSIITPGYFRDYLKKKAEDFPDTFLDIHIPNGEIELSGIAGDDTFSDVETLDEKPEIELTKEEKRKLNAFKAALAETVMGQVIPHLNLVPSDQGIVTSSDKQFGTVTFRILTPQQITELQNQYRAKAYMLIQKYVTDTGGIAPVGSFSDE